MSENRILLRLAGAQPPPLDVRRFTVRERLSALWSVSVVAVLPDPTLDVNRCVDRGAALVLQRGIGDENGVPVRIWSGICSDVSHVSAEEGGAAVYAFTIVPELWRAGVGRNSRVFQHLSNIEIVLRILKEWAIEPPDTLVLRNIDVGDLKRHPKLEMQVQYDESDLQFISRLLEESGITFHFEFASKVSGGADDVGRKLTKLVLDAEAHLARPPRNSKEDDEDDSDEDDADEDDSDEDADDSGDEEDKDSTKRVIGPISYLGTTQAADFGRSMRFATNGTVTRFVRTGAVTLIDHDYRMRLGGRAAELTTLEKGSERVYEEQSSIVGGLQIERDRELGAAFTSEPVASRAAAELRAARNFATIREFDTNAIELTPGAVVQLHGDSDRPELVGGPLLLVASEMAGNEFGEWSVHCAAISSDAAYRPPRLTPKPRIVGMQTAIVVGPKESRVDDEQIHCDPLGRVRVQFPWDRVHQYGEPMDATRDDGDRLGSCWVRVVTPYAGRRYGFIAVPRVGHEVAIAFIDGDPNQPVIVRSLHNGPSAPPFSPIRQKTITGIRTNSTPGAGGYNEFSMDDHAPQKVELQAERVLDTVIKGAESHSVGAKRTTTIGANDLLHVGQKWKLIAGDHETGIWVTENNMVLARVGGANGSEVMLSGTGIFINAKADIHLHAHDTIHLSAGSQVDIASKLADINPPTRHPVPVELAGYDKAGRPQPGATIPATFKPSGRGERHEAPGQLVEDVDFRAPPPAHDGQVVPVDPSDLEEEGGTRQVRPEDSFGTQAIVAGLSGKPLDPAIANRDIIARYGQYMPADIRGRDVPVAVLGEEQYARLRDRLGISPDTAAFYHLPTAALPNGAVVMQPNAPPDFIYHELLHARTNPSFMSWASTDTNTAMEEATTQLLTRRAIAGTGLVPQTTAYDANVARLEALRIPSGMLEQAYFGGNTAPLARHIQQRTGQSPAQFFAGLNGGG